MSGSVQDALIRERLCQPFRLCSVRAQKTHAGLPASRPSFQCSGLKTPVDGATLARMAWEWVASVGTAVVGVAGIAGTVMSGRWQANVTVRLAREERTQARLERSYQEVQRVVERSAQWAASAMPIVGGPGQDLYPLPPEDDAHTLEASALRLYWSPEVRQLVQTWTNARNHLVIYVNAARTTEALRDQTWMKVPELKQALRDAEDALVARMSHELLTVEPVKRRWRPQVPRWQHRTPRVAADTTPVLDVQRAEAG